MKDTRRRRGRLGVYLAWLLALLVTIAPSGCKQVQGVLRRAPALAGSGRGRGSGK